MLAILTTHPIQYQVPVWRELARRGVPLEVWYMSEMGAGRYHDKGFARDISWDIDLLGGYRSRVLPMRTAGADTASFRGLRLGALDLSSAAALLINGWFPQAYWQAASQAFRARVPVLLRAETNLMQQPPWWKRAVRRGALTWLLRRVAVALPIGRANRAFYEHHGVSADRMIASPYCVDNHWFASAAAVAHDGRPSPRDRWNIPPDAACFLFSGKLIPSKRVHDLIEAFLRDGGGPRHLLIAGDGELGADLERRARASVRGGRSITFAGFLSQRDMPAAYAAADCLVLPSDRRETWGLVVNEAMACGLPALVSDEVGCGPDLIDPSRTGDVFPVGDIAALAGLLDAWSDRARCERARRAVLERIDAYSIARAADGIAAAAERTAAAQVG
jgi:glycosyltransferase involved in cell wall biosynthesis